MLGLKKENKNIYLRRLILGATILVTAMIQNTAGLFPDFFGARALLLIPATICIAMFEREVSGLFFGLFAGALWDMCSSAAWSYNAILLTIFAFACGALIKYIMRNHLVCAFLLCGISTLIYCLLSWFITYVFNGYSTAIKVLLEFYIPSAVYTIVFVPVYYFFVRFISKKFR